MHGHNLKGYVKPFIDMVNYDRIMKQRILIKVYSVEGDFLNNVYFKCQDCMEYIDAGYRWSYCSLIQTGVICEETVFNVKNVLDYTPYWDGALEDGWLQQLLPKVRAFLEKHKNHNVIYTELDSLYDNDEWLLLLPVCDEDDYCEITPRYFVETLEYKDWKQVEAHIEKLKASHVWYDNYENMKERAKERFYYLLYKKD